MPKKKSKDPLFDDGVSFDNIFQDTKIFDDEEATVEPEVEAKNPKDPLKDVEYTGKFEPDAKVELNAMQQAFRDRTLKEQARFELVTDSEYWLCACFLTREQKDALLAGLGLERGEKYIDGRVLAKKLRIELPPDPQFPQSKVDMSWFNDLGSH